MLALKPNAAETIQRLRTLYGGLGQDRIFASFLTPSDALRRFAAGHADGECGAPDPAERLAFWEDYFRERVTLQDDSIPALYPSEFDQGLYGALVGCKVRFLCTPETGWISSMVPPLLSEWKGIDTLKIDSEAPFYCAYLSTLDQYEKATKGRFGISHFILINGFNFAYELLGATETYMGALDEPERLKKALEMGLQVNGMVQDAFFKKIPLFEGGTCAFSYQWLPGRIVSESVDPFHMTSAAYFEEWGRGPAEAIMARYDGGVIHLHGNGRHLFEAVATVKGLKALFLGDDKGYEPAIEAAKGLRKKGPALPFCLYAEYPDFVEQMNRKSLPGGVMYVVKNTPDIASANRLMEKVRAYRV